MGVLLSICFKTKGDDSQVSTSQYQAKKKAALQSQVGKQKSFSKQHLLSGQESCGGGGGGGRPPPGGYCSLSQPTSPSPSSRARFEKQQSFSGWGKSPSSPGSTSRGSDIDYPIQPQFFTPPPSPSPHDGLGRSHPSVTRSFSLKVGRSKNNQNNSGDPNQHPREKRSHRRKQKP